MHKHMASQRCQTLRFVLCCYVIGLFNRPQANHKHNIQRNVVLLWAAVSLGGALRDIPKNGSEGDYFVRSLRIQPPLIRSSHYVRNAKKDACDSWPELPYWWHKSVLNPDRSADMLSEQFWIIGSTIIQCCDVQKSNSENLSSPSLEFLDSALSLLFGAVKALTRLVQLSGFSSVVLSWPSQF